MASVSKSNLQVRFDKAITRLKRVEYDKAEFDVPLRDFDLVIGLPSHAQKYAQLS